MNKVSKPSKKNSGELIAKINAEAAAQHKTPIIYMAEQSDDLRRMFIGWHKKDIKQLENIKSKN